MALLPIQKQTHLNKGAGKNAMKVILGIDPDKIVKITSGTAILAIGQSYREAIINNALKNINAPELTNSEIKELISIIFGDYKPKDRQWGEHVKNDPLSNAIIENYGKKYLVLYFYGSKSKVTHLYEGKEIDLKDPKFDRYQKPAKKENEVAKQHIAEKLEKLNSFFKRDKIDRRTNF